VLLIEDSPITGSTFVPYESLILMACLVVVAGQEFNVEQFKHDSKRPPLSQTHFRVLEAISNVLV